MIITVIEYGGTPRQIECESFEFRSNQVENWMRIKYKDGSTEEIHDVCVIKAESEEEDLDNLDSMLTKYNLCPVCNEKIVVSESRCYKCGYNFKAKSEVEI